MYKWFIISPECTFGMQDVKTSEGIYEAGRILPVGSIVPFEWKGLQRIRDLYLPANQLIEYEPSETDYPILYMLWPSVKPDKARFAPKEARRIGKVGDWASGWYRICKPDEKRNLSSVPYGLSALCDVEGVCKAGQMALVGDIVPAAFFTGLSDAQFDRLESIGLCSETWLEAFHAKQRNEYMRHLARPAIERVGVSQAEREKLYEQFPAMKPQDSLQPVSKVTKSIRKA